MGNLEARRRKNKRERWKRRGGIGSSTTPLESNCSSRSKSELPLGPPPDEQGTSEKDWSFGIRIFEFWTVPCIVTGFFLRVCAQCALLVAFLSTSNLLALRILPSATWQGARRYCCGVVLVVSFISDVSAVIVCETDRTHELARRHTDAVKRKFVACKQECMAMLDSRHKKNKKKVAGEERRSCKEI